MSIRQNRDVQRIGNNRKKFNFVVAKRKAKVARLSKQRNRQ
jgi:hypothetical protein